MDRIEYALSMLDYLMNTRRKRHLVGGVLLSVSMLFGGLAFTVITIKNEEDTDEE